MTALRSIFRSSFHTSPVTRGLFVSGKRAAVRDMATVTGAPIKPQNADVEASNAASVNGGTNNWSRPGPAEFDFRSKHVMLKGDEQRS